MFKLSELLFFLAVGYFLFNGRKLGQLFGLVGESTRAFRSGLRGESDRPVRDVREISQENPRGRS